MEGIYLDVVLEELLAIRRRERDRVLDVGATRVRAEMSVAHGGQTDGIVVLPGD